MIFVVKIYYVDHYQVVVIFGIELVYIVLQIQFVLVIYSLLDNVMIQHDDEAVMSLLGYMYYINFVSFIIPIIIQF